MFYLKRFIPYSCYEILLIFRVSIIWKHYILYFTASFCLIPNGSNTFHTCIYLPYVVAKFDISEVNYQSLATGGTFLIGQEQDIVNGAFDEHQAFSGNVTQVEMWKNVLSEENILALSKCEVDTVDPDNNVISWKKVDSEWSIHGNVYVMEASLASTCQNKYAYHRTMLIMKKTSYESVRLSCDQVNGKLPIIKHHSQHIHDQEHTTIKELQRKTNELMGNLSMEHEYKNCVTENGMVKFWLGQYKKNSTSDWFSPYKEDEDFSHFQVPQTSSQCVYVLGNDVFQEKCEDFVACGVCNLVEENEIPKAVMKMKGICNDDLWRRKIYDLNYYIHGIKNGRPYFR